MISWTRCWNVRKLVLMMLAMTLGASQTGCITFSALMGNKRSPSIDTRMLEAQGYSIPPGGMPSPVNLDPADGPRVVLEIRGGEKHMESIPLPLERAIFIEELVQEASLHRELGRLEIYIMRPNPGKPPIRLDSRTNDNGKATSIGQNYALLPGDHIIVIPDNRSSLEKFIDGLIRA